MAAAARPVLDPNFRMDDPKYYTQAGRLLLTNNRNQCTIHHIHPNKRAEWLAKTRQLYVAVLTNNCMEAYKNELQVTIGKGLEAISNDGRERVDAVVNATADKTATQFMNEITYSFRNFLDPMFTATKVDGEPRRIKPDFKFGDDFTPVVKAQLKGYSRDEAQARYAAGVLHAKMTMAMQLERARQLSEAQNRPAEAAQQEDEKAEEEPSTPVRNLPPYGNVEEFSAQNSHIIVADVVQDRERWGNAINGLMALLRNLGSANFSESEID